MENTPPSAQFDKEFVKDAERPDVVTPPNVVDLFAGPGGWDVAARELGIEPLGIEQDKAACLTREAAGLRTLRADVSKPPLREDMEITGLIASPPCQTFSMAGKGAGRDALDQVLRGVETLAMGEPIPYEEYEDIRTGLVLEPLAWALRHKPEWLAWEQVPTVLPVWEACAAVLRASGYSVATGLLQAEQYGVPQTRKRAVLIASRTRTVALPAPTHTKYRKGKPREDDSMAGLLPWVSMADALGWGDAIVRSNYGTGGDPQARGERSSDEPAGTVTGKIDRNVVLRNNTSANAAERATDEPSPTLYSGSRMNGVYWQMAAAGATARFTAGQVPRDPEEPSATITGKGTATWTPADPDETWRKGRPEWTSSSPSPVVAGDARIAPRGCKHPREGCCSQWNGTPGLQFGPGTVRVTVAEAAVLQSFPADYPWRGTKTKQYQQVGNAIPPLLALHVLVAATGLLTEQMTVEAAA